MAGLLAVVAFVVAFIFQLANIAFGRFNWISVMLIGLALLALHTAGYLTARRL